MASRPSFFEEVLRETFGSGDAGNVGGDGAEGDDDFGKNPTRTWPMSQSSRGHVRSCIEFSPGTGGIMDATTPTNPSGGSALVDLRTSSRLSNPFLDLMFSSNLLEGDDDDDQANQSNSQSLSLSLLSNEEGDSDSGGTLSEVFDSLSRFSEACLASAEAITSASCSTGAQVNSGPQSSSSVHVVYDSVRLRGASTSYSSRGTSGVHDTIDGNGGGSGSGNKMDLSSNGYMHNMSRRRGSIPAPSSSRHHFSYTATDEPDHLPDPSSLDSGAGTSLSSSHRQDGSSRGGHEPLFSRVWSDYGSGSDAGNNSTVSVPSYSAAAGSSTSAHHHSALYNQHGRRSSCSALLATHNGTNSAVEFDINSVLAVQEVQPYVSCVDWQERCMELEVALQRFGEQAARVRLLLRDKLAELEQRVVEAETRADEAEDKVRVMEQQLSEATSNAGSWTMEDEEKLCTLQNTVREKERVISRLECQVEEQRLLRLQESRQIEEKASRIKDWVSNKLRDLEEQNEHLREQNQKCETQLELLRSRLTQLSQLNTIQSKSKENRHSTEDSSRGSYEGDRPPSDESPPPDSGDAQSSQPQAPTTRPMSATAACLAAIRRRSGAFDSAEDRQRKRNSNLSSGSNSGTTSSLTQDRRSQNSRSSRVDSGSVDMETPQSLSPRSPLDALEALDASLPPLPSQQQPTSCVVNGISGPSSALHNNTSSVNNNNNHVMISSPTVHPVPAPVPVTIPTPISISLAASPATPVETMIGGAESTQSLNIGSERRTPVVPPRRCRTRSPTPNTSKGPTPRNYSPPAEEEDASVLRARLDAECQQLARDIQAAVQELVRPELTIGRARAMDENHDYSEIYTPSSEKPEGLCLSLSQPPPPPMHRFPSWESRIYEVAAGGLKVPSKEDTSSSGEIPSTSSRHDSFHSLSVNFSIPVYTTVKGRASQIRSAPFSGDSSDSSDGEEMGSGSGGSGPSHPISSGETDISSPGKSVASSIANSLSPLHRSSSPAKSLRREPSMESEMSDDYAIPPDAFASETNSMDIALSSGCQNLTLGSTTSVNFNSTVSLLGASANSIEGSPRKESLEKSGYLTKLGGKLKTWRKRWFVLKNGTLIYWKSSAEVNRRSGGREILLDENCRIAKGDGAATFEIATGKKTYYLTAESNATVDEWVRILQNVVRRNATKLVLSMEENKPTIQGWLIKVKNGHAKRCWCVLIGKMFLSFRTHAETVPTFQVNMRDCRVEGLEQASDSDNDEEKDENVAVRNSALTIEITPSHASPIYLHLPTKQDKDSWLYHLTIVSGKGPNAGTQFEQLVHKLMDAEGDPKSSVWKNPLLLHSKESITSPLTSLSSVALQNEAIKLFKSCLLFMSVPSEQSAIEYHVTLAQNILQLCLDQTELQSELICTLVKQTSRLSSLKNSPQVNRTLSKIKHSRFLLNATHSFFVCDSSDSHGKVKNNSLSSQSNNSPSGSYRSNNNSATSSSPSRSSRGGSSRSSPARSKTKASSSSVPSSPLLSQNHSMHHHASNHSSSKSGIPNFVLIQGWQLLALAVSLFLPKNSKLLWYLKEHLLRNVDTKSETGKYAAYCQRSIERTLANGPRLFKPSRMEVLSILMKNPFHHSLPHSVPVHFLDGKYHIVGFDGSTTVEEFLLSLCHQIGCREPSHSGFGLVEDDPFDKDLQLSLKPKEKICDVISNWETVLREKGSGKFETRRAVTLSFVNRIYRRSGILQETDKERLLLCYQANQAVVAGKFPCGSELALELAALVGQMDNGDYKPEKGRGSGGSHQVVIQVLEKYYPIRYRENLAAEEFKNLCDSLVQKWVLLKGKSCLDCVRAYLNCTRKWPYFGATLFSVKVRGTHVVEDGANVWAAIGEDGIAILTQQLQPIAKYSLSSVQTFGGTPDDNFMAVIEDCSKKRRLIFSGISKIKVLEMTNIVAEYINSCLESSVYNAGTLSTTGGLTRHNSLKSSRFQSCKTLPPSTPRLDRKLNNYGGEAGPSSVQRCDSIQMCRTPRP